MTCALLPTIQNLQDGWWSSILQILQKDYWHFILSARKFVTVIEILEKQAKITSWRMRLGLPAVTLNSVSQHETLTRRHDAENDLQQSRDIMSIRMRRLTLFRYFLITHQHRSSISSTANGRQILQISVGFNNIK